MKLVVQVKLLPTAEQAPALEATLHACNRAATWVAQVAFEQQVKDRNGLQKLLYADVKATFGLSAKPFDDRCLSWQYDARTVSIWTVDGRMKNVRYTGSADQLKTLTSFRKGESDPVQRHGTWYLIATCDIPDPDVHEPVDWIGVDRGIVNLATTSDGANYQGRRLTRYRRWQARKRAELQKKQTRSATRRLARRSRKEHRHATHMNHKISKEIVSVAQRTGRGIAVEQLDGIRDRVRLR
ncbi:transposase, partial [Streptomyces sp. NPDC002754]